MKTIVNIASGKGGTGKTMLTAVLAATLSDKTKKSILVVDMDIFVRGLSSMYYHECDQSLELLPDKNLLSVTDFFTKKTIWERSWRKLGILEYNGYTFFSKPFSIMPAVHTIDEEYEFQSIMPNSVNSAVEPIAHLLHMLRQNTEFDYIFLDNRAGYDELVAASYLLSDFTICIDEDDPISKITSDLLVKQLRSSPEKYKSYLENTSAKVNAEKPEKSAETPEASPKKLSALTAEKQTNMPSKDIREIPEYMREFHSRLEDKSYQRPRIFSIVNKVRNFTKDYNDAARSDILFLGGIPYDASIAASFGSSAFWSMLSGSLYRSELCKAWDKLASKIALTDVSLTSEEQNEKASNTAVPKRKTFPQKIAWRFEQSLHILPGNRRIFFVLGWLLFLCGLTIFFASNAYASMNLYGKFSIMVALASGLLLFLSPLNFSAFRPKRKDSSDSSNKSNS